LQESGVEVIDLLPLFLKAKRDDPKSIEPLLSEAGHALDQQGTSDRGGRPGAAYQGIFMVYRKPAAAARSTGFLREKRCSA
jgi:hypothetical protein